MKSEHININEKLLTLPSIRIPLYLMMSPWHCWPSHLCYNNNERFSLPHFIGFQLLLLHILRFLPQLLTLPQRLTLRLRPFMVPATRSDMRARTLRDPPTIQKEKRDLTEDLGCSPNSSVFQIHQRVHLLSHGLSVSRNERSQPLE